MPSRSPRCPRCASAFESGGADHTCGSCLADPPPFGSVRAPYLYGGALADAISRFKYSSATWLAGPLAGLMNEVEITDAAELVLPVPLHPTRLVARGFNQSALLAAALARRLGLPLDTSAMARIADTPPQARQGRAERLGALRGAFAVRRTERVRDRRVLLVDDVVTTTATVRAASRALLAAGAAAVDVVALARAEWPDRVADHAQTG